MCWSRCAPTIKGEGGSFALLSLIARNLGHKKWTAALVMLGVLATCLFYGDAMITPAISVLSAVEGLTIVEAALQPLVIPISIVILIGLFLVQSRGTAKVGSVFGPVILVYFAALAVLGVTNILRASGDRRRAQPDLGAATSSSTIPSSPSSRWARCSSRSPGAETLYADMGHFGRRAIGFSWLTLVYPCLMLNYLGQGALLLGDPAAATNPFYLMAPDWARLPLVGIATAATIIASQAVISGAFSVTHQAVQLGFLPRLRTEHTSEKAAGQIYIPAVNWGLLAMVILLVLGFRESGQPGVGLWHRGDRHDADHHDDARRPGVPGVALEPAARDARRSALFLLVDGTYFASNITKIPDGGWFPLLVAAISFTVLTTWAKGRAADARAARRNRRCRCRCSSSRRRRRCTACAAPRCSCRPRPTACPRRCSTISSTTRCFTSAC